MVTIWLAALVALLVAACGGSAGPPTVIGAHGLPACDAGNMSATWVDAGGAAGTDVTRVQLVNHGRRACALSGHPVSLTGVEPNGRLVPVHGVRWSGPGSPFVGDEPAVLAARGGAADLALSTTSAETCLRDHPLPAVSRLRIGLPTGPVTSAWYPYTDAGRAFSFPCPPTTSSFALWTNLPGVGFARVPGVIGLQAIAAPMTFSAAGGQSIHYIVALRNLTRNPVRLSPCPAYSDVLTAISLRGRRSHRVATMTASGRLPCTKPDTIRAGGEQSFPMTLNRPHVPGRERPLFETIRWRLRVLDGYGPETTLSS